ncbi:hypothetical protein [Leisingera sp. M658]|uniref:hypothetical protein n=1 Tax=Leisingera sp. M658 TaxID=2867015 RepID=UPI0021A474B0|nr:hypothetical protein [Leisingera sp. M658]UWQ77397.1 hypothetical protein K3724_22715 [Leisingera sp. M658]
MPNFPASMPAPEYLPISFSGSEGGLQVSKMDTGPSKRRRRTTAAPQVFSLTFAPVTEAALAEFEDFFRDDLAGGVLSFTMAHPIYETERTWRFKDEETYSGDPIGEDAYQLQMVLDLMP